MNIYAISSLITAIASFMLGGFVLVKNRKSRQSQVWVLTSLAIFIWTFSLFWCFESSTKQEALFWQKMLYLGTTLIPILFYNYSLLLLGTFKKNRFFVYVGYLIAAFFIIILFFTNLMIDGILPRNDMGYWAIGFSNIYYFYLGYFIIYVYLLLFSLFQGLKNNNGIKKEQIRFVYYAALIGFIGGSFNFLLDFGFKYPVGNLFVFLYVFFITYAITRYRLMDIRLLIKKSTVFASLVVIIGAVLIITSNLLSILFETFFDVKNNWLSSVIVAILVAIIFQPLRNWLEKITNRIFFAKVYNSSELLSRVAKISASTIDLKKLASGISHELEGAFYNNRIAFALINERKRLELAYQENFNQKALFEFIKGKEKVLPIYFSQSRSSQVIDELKIKYEAGIYKPKNIELLNSLNTLGISLVVPLYDKEDIIGVICIGQRKSGDPYSQEDIKIIEIIAGQISLAVKNAALYGAIQNFNKTLQQKVDDQTMHLQVANKELQRLDDAKSEFLSIASHQLRTPVTIIKGYASMIIEGSYGKASKKIIGVMKNVYTANDRLLNLIENLLDISRIEAGRLEFDLKNVSLADIVRPIVADFQQKAKAKKLKLQFFENEKTPKVIADTKKISEVISNIIDNSVKYTIKGEIIVSLHEEGTSVVFSCQDTGLGILSSDLPRLFHKFVRGKDMMKVHTEGTGLGMYFARTVVENMGGRIWAESPGKNKGSKFCFSLPLADKRKAKKIKTA